MKFSVFVFSLCFGMMVSRFFEINEKMRIQIWHVPEDIVNTKEIPFHQNFYLSNTETYIILEKTVEHDIYHYSLFYWVGSKSNLMKRRNVAKRVVWIQGYLQKIQNGRLIFFRREIEGLESEKFCNLLQLGERPEVTNLYNIGGSLGHLISLSPLSRNSFYNTNTYVLQKGRKVIVWIADYALPGKVNAARLLAKRIVKVDLQKQDEKIEQYISVIDNLQTEKNYEKFHKYFLKSKDLQNQFYDISCKQSNEEIKKDINSSLQVYVLYTDEHHVNVRTIPEDKRPLWLTSFRKNETLLLVNIASGYIFIYLGKAAPTELIQSTLLYMENIFFSSYNEWRNITIVREGELLPTSFIIHFYDEIDKLLGLSNSSKIDGSWSQKAKNAEIQP